MSPSCPHCARPASYTLANGESVCGSCFARAGERRMQARGVPIRHLAGENGSFRLVEGRLYRSLPGGRCGGEVGVGEVFRGWWSGQARGRDGEGAE